MTERQHRLQDAGELLVRGATLLGGAVGLLFFCTTLTGQQRLVFLFLAGALAMPAVLIALVVAKPDPGRPAAPFRIANRNGICLVGAVFGNALIFVEPSAYLALVLVLFSGVTLVVIVRATEASRPTG